MVASGNGRGARTLRAGFDLEPRHVALPVSHHPLQACVRRYARNSHSSFYILLYIPTYGQKTLHLPAYTGFTATEVGTNASIAG
jgi:hypothetical protein